MYPKPVTLLDYSDANVWVLRHLHLCDHIKDWSKDPSSQYGCFLTDMKYRPIGHGVNGFARGFKDTPERWNDRQFKYRHVIHAEENAILNSSTSLEMSYAFVNGPPCSSCMSKLAQVGCIAVYCWEPSEAYLARYSLDESMQVALETGVAVYFVTQPKQ